MVSHEKRRIAEMKQWNNGVSVRKMKKWGKGRISK